MAVGPLRIGERPLPAPTPHVLLDFDGTLVEGNLARELVDRFRSGPTSGRDDGPAPGGADPPPNEPWDATVARLGPTSTEAMREYTRRTARWVPGAPDLLRWLELRRIPTAIVSGGFDLYISAVLDRAGTDLPVFADHLAFGPGERVRLEHPFAHPRCRLCGVCKASIVRTAGRGGHRTVFVGDGRSDRFAAEVADIVFARGALRGILDDERMPYLPFENLFEVRARLARWIDGVEPWPERRAPGSVESPCPISRSARSSTAGPVPVRSS